MLCFRWIGCPLFAAVAWSSLGGAPIAAQTAWKAGVAKVKITPEKPMWLAGYSSRTKPAEGAMHDLWVKALALEAADGSRGVVVSADLLGFPKALYEGIIERAGKDHGVQRRQVMLTSSHTHSGPALSGALMDCYPLDDQQKALIEEYSRQLVEKVAGAIGQALAQMAPATLWRGQGSTDFGVNRRNNGEAEVVKLREQGLQPKGPSDHDVPVLVVRSPEGPLRAVVFGYACHSTTLSGYEWSGDYSGFTQIALEKEYPGSVAMFYSGCGADQNPLPRRTVELCQKYGKMLGDAVQEVVGKPLEPIDSKLQTAFEFADVGMEGIATPKSLEEQSKDSEIYARRARRLGALLEQGEKFPTSYPVPVQVWRLGGQQLWIALGGEVVVDYSLAFKAKYGAQTWVAGYSNDCMSYIPSERIWKEGRYESNAFFVYGVPADRWAPDIEQKLTAAVDRLVKGLQ
ncbi:MAG: neutral/alkaline non-lysosomal ceramidase N-terminal domain-containing protein [Pirellulales bacterium]|nr:neutral/alkaline non-lysosomal ceramidase N-terminal domain-containing protein [Pirellulales bacterium]